MTATLLLLIKLSVAGLILAIGMSSTLRDLLYLWRRPGLLLRSLLAMYVAVPLVALLVARSLSLPTPVAVAILVLAICKRCCQATRLVGPQDTTIDSGFSSQHPQQSVLFCKSLKNQLERV